MKAGLLIFGFAFSWLMFTLIVFLFMWVLRLGWGNMPCTSDICLPALFDAFNAAGYPYPAIGFVATIIASERIVKVVNDEASH